MFCDIAGSSALSERYDPEDLRRIIAAYHQAIGEVIQRHKGYVAQYLGDGILVYFGYPQAHEDDARRAAQAALDVLAALDRLNQNLDLGEGSALALRLGLHTGLTVVGAVSRGGRDTLALGDTPNIAARLQDLGEPNTITLSADTRHLIERHFECESLGSHHLRGFSRPTEVFQLTGSRERPLTEHLLDGGAQTPMVGRMQESELLMDRLAQAAAGVGHVVLLNGEAGLGKSRLVAQLRSRAYGEEYRVLECWGSPHFQNSYLFPIINLLRRTLDIGATTPHDKALARLEQNLSGFGLTLNESVPLIADLLNIRIPEERYPPLGLSPRRLKLRLRQTLRKILESIAAEGPVLFIVEDLHWIDPSTLEFLGALIEYRAIDNLLALLTYRPEFAPPWNTQVHVSRINLNRLTRKQTGDMIRWLAGDKTLPIEVFRQIVDKTDGIPLFVEELTKMVLESGLLIAHDGHYELSGPLSGLSIPSTLRDSLMARLDRLGAEKELVQIGATLGREFLFALLQAVAPDDERSLRERLSRLVQGEMFYQQGQPPQTSYAFSHALVQEAAYESLLKSTRQEYHKLIAGALQDQFPEIAEQNPELVAHHLTEAGQPAEALKYWLAAGRTAMLRYAIAEALAHLRRGLEVAEQLPESLQRVQAELALRSTLGLGVMMSKGYGAPEVEQAFGRARTLCEQLGEPTATLPVMAGLWEFYIVRAELRTAQELASRLDELAPPEAQHPLRLEAERILGTTLFWRGHLGNCLEHLERGTGGDDVAVLALRSNEYSQDPRVASLATSSCALWLMGRPDAGLEQARRATALARQIAHPFSDAYAQTFLTVLHLLRGDLDAALDQAQRLVELASRYDFAFWRAIGRMCEAWASVERPIDQRIERFDQGLDEYRATGGRLASSYFESLKVELYRASGRLDLARQQIEQTLSGAETRDEGFYRPELQRLHADLLAEEGALDPDGLAEAYQQACDSARARGVTALALRAATSLARLWSEHGEVARARELLGALLGAIDGGSQTLDPATARRLYDTLSRAEASQR
jgi:class 3 adenylate cyclase/predicted ATPase